MNRYVVQSKINEIESQHGRIVKSVFTISNWIMESKRFENMSKKFSNRDTLKYIWQNRGLAIDELLKTELLDVKINKNHSNRCYWLYILSIERCDTTVHLAIPCPMYKDRLKHHSELETTDIDRDMIIVDGVECRYGKKFKLGFIIENMNKSRIKLIEKMNGN